MSVAKWAGLCIPNPPLVKLGVVRVGPRPINPPCLLKMESPSPEYKALIQCSATLFDCIQQSPSDIVDRLKPSGKLAPGVLAFLSNPKHNDDEKARKIIDVMTKQVKIHSQVFHIFVTAMKTAGSWTEEAVNILENKYKTLLASTSHSEQPNDPDEVEQLSLGGSDSTTQAQAAPISDIPLPKSGECLLTGGTY